MWLSSRPGSILRILYLTYSSVAVVRDGNWLEHRGDKDFSWHLGLIGTCGHDHVYHHSLCVQVRTRSKSIESSFNRVSVNLDSM